MRCKVSHLLCHSNSVTDLDVIGNLGTFDPDVKIFEDASWGVGMVTLELRNCSSCNDPTMDL